MKKLILGLGKLKRWFEEKRRVKACALTSGRRQPPNSLLGFHNPFLVSAYCMNIV
jgi:hypothetical protein